MAITTTYDKYAVLTFGNWSVPAVPISNNGLDTADFKWFLHGLPTQLYTGGSTPPPVVVPPVTPGEHPRKTFLEYCNDVCEEAGVGGGGRAIVTTAGQVGQLARIVRYVKQAWVEIQNIHQHTGLHWRWMRSHFKLVTVAGQSEYGYNSPAIVDGPLNSAIIRFRNWMILDYNNPPKSYRQASGIGSQGFLNFIEWDYFNYLYRTGNQNQGQPAHISISPSNMLAIGPTPNAAFVITGDYMKGAHHFVNDTDTADLPVDFEDVIVFKALSKYGLQKNAPEAVTAGEDGYATYLGMLESDQLSEIQCAGALA